MAHHNARGNMNTHAIFVAVLTIVASCSALAHGGGLNAEGCHNNRKTGDYHCQRAPALAAPKQVPDARSQGSPNNSVISNKLAAPQPGASKCYVGPRGGTYTITKSGRKNYSGC